MPHVYLLLASPSPSIENISSNERVLAIRARLYDGVRSSELHTATSFHSKLSITDAHRFEHIPAESASSAKHGGRVAFDMLRREGYLSRTLMVRYSLPVHAINHHGASADLSFALALIVHHFRRQSFPSIAATGVLKEDGTVISVHHVSDKLYAAMKVLPTGSAIFLALENKEDVPAEVATHCEQHGITIHYISHLHDACRILGIEIRQYYHANPYRGLETFTLEYASLFFGRDRHIEEARKQLLERLKNKTPSLLILGASGSGKSSFIQAGLLHELIYGTDIPLELEIKTSVFQPRQLLLEQHQNSLRDKESIGYFSERLQKALCLHWKDALGIHIESGFLDVPSIVDTLKQAIRTNVTTLPAKQILYVWVIDQLEELFTLSWTKEERQVFIELITALPQQGVWIITSLRSDFYAHYQQENKLLQHFKQGGQYDLLPPDKAALGSIIREPARLAGLSFEESQGISLDERILSDSGYQSSALPLLEFTLKNLYEECDKSKKILLLENYQKMGGIEGSIGNWAQRVYQLLPKEQQNPEHLASLVRNLTIVGTKAQLTDKKILITARSVPLNSLPKHTHDLVRSLTQARLLTLEQDGGKRIMVRVTHEALLSNWALVHQQIKTDKDQLLLQQQLIQEYRRWSQAGQKERQELLIPNGSRLKQARALLNDWKENLPDELSQYIQTSYQYSSGHKRRIWGASAAVIVSLLAVALFYWIAYIKSSVTYYSDFKRINTVPVPQGDALSVEEQRRKNDYYKISRQGLLGQITAISFVNQHGRCPNDVVSKKLKSWIGLNKQDRFSYDFRLCEIRYKYDAKNQLSKEEGFNSRGTKKIFTFSYDSTTEGEYIGRQDSQAMTNAKYINFKWSAKGELTELSFQDNNKYEALDENLVHRYQYRYDKGNKIEESYFDEKGKRALHGNTGAHILRYRYTDNGNNTEVETTYFGSDEKRVFNKKGFSRQSSQYNQQRDEIKRAFFDKKDRKTLNADNIHFWERRYNQWGNEIEEAFFDVDNKPILGKMDVHLTRRNYDNNGNEIKRAYFDTHEREILDKKKNVHIWSQVYDSKGNATKIIFLGKDEKPCLSNGKVHGFQRKFDAQGNEIERSYFGVNGKPVTHIVGFHRWTGKYDKYNNRVETRFYGVDGKPTLHSDGNHSWTREYDGQSKELETAYFGKDSKPGLHKAGYHRWKRQYDRRGNEVEIAFFGKDGKPILRKDGYSVWKRKYDRRGRVTERKYVGVNEEAVTNSDGFHLSRITYKTDVLKNRIEEIRYFTTLNKRGLHKSGVHMKSQKFDERGKEVETAYFGVNDEPILHMKGYHRWRSEYDLKGEKKKTTYYDIDNKPIKKLIK